MLDTLSSWDELATIAPAWLAGMGGPRSATAFAVAPRPCGTFPRASRASAIGSWGRSERWKAGLAATLGLAGVSAADSLLATFVYRLFSYWLALPLGLLGAAVPRRRYARAVPA